MEGYNYIIDDVPIYKAALHDDWDSVEQIFEEDPELMTKQIGYWWETPLIIAVGTNCSHRFVQKLVARIVVAGDADKLFWTDYAGNNPLHYAAKVGNTIDAKLLVEQNQHMTLARNPYGHAPLKLAAWHGKKETLKYLLKVTRDLLPGEEGTSPYTGVAGGDLITLTIVAGFYDVALDIIDLHPNIVLEFDRSKQTALQVLATKPEIFPSGSGLGFWGRFIYSLIHVKSSGGVTDQVNIFSSIFKQFTAGCWGVLRYVVIPPHRLKVVPGAALQMQRELQWFKEVEKLEQPSYRETLNKNGQTPKMVFTDAHKDLLVEAQDWMKTTASSCSLVAALIVTMAFAGAFAVPGGNQDDGKPHFLNNRIFAFFSSSTSVLMFLGILTRYAEDDFLNVLPKRMTIGLVSLFLSLASTMVAFSATLTLILQDKVTWIVAPLVAATSIPLCWFGLLQFPLLVELLYTSYGPSIFHPGEQTIDSLEKLASILPWKQGDASLRLLNVDLDSIQVEEESSLYTEVAGGNLITLTITAEF
ncbi:hypothetical protein OSB04_010182 [Centaurea solstitialis]|uniref:PGG domain-containing protein n=1 Tax=Centaurea solstitialis TaxID=347529 RepID=A0AA38T715_9ASTR|nr:hypothetical protein OSB04_010182 [Centaurea solstitialis]